jgi:hypothetical protein
MPPPALSAGFPLGDDDFSVGSDGADEAEGWLMW